MSVASPPETPPRLRLRLRLGIRAPKAHTEMRVDVLGTSVRYIEGGQTNPGPPLVLLHGFQNGADIWYPHTFPALAARRHVIALDLPGFGYSGALATYSNESYAEFMQGFLDEVGLGEIDLLGHSMGGQVAIATAAAQPDRIRRLVLVASAGLPMPGSRRLARLAMAADRSAYHFRLYPTIVRLTLRVRAGRACYHMMRDDSVFGLLDNLTMPTLIIWGSRDRVLPLENATIFARTIPKARLSIMRGCGHMPFYQKHEQFEKLLLYFLSQ